MTRVVLEVVTHFDVGRPGAQPHWPSGEARVPGSREQSKRVPSIAPAVADAGLGIEDEELLANFLQVISHH